MGNRRTQNVAGFQAIGNGISVTVARIVNIPVNLMEESKSLFGVAHVAQVVVVSRLFHCQFRKFQATFDFADLRVYVRCQTV